MPDQVGHDSIEKNFGNMQKFPTLLPGIFCSKEEV
jgi:hypothetical protein